MKHLKWLTLIPCTWDVNKKVKYDVEEEEMKENIDKDSCMRSVRQELVHRHPPNLSSS